MVFRSLRTKFMILFFFFFFVPYALLSLLSISRSREMMKDSTIDHLTNLVEVKETAIEQWVEERISYGSTLTKSPEVKSLDPKQIASCFTLFNHLVSAYREIWVFDIAGEVVAGVGPTVPQAEKGLDKVFGGRPLIATGTFGSGMEAPKPSVTLIFGIEDPEGRPAGALKALLDLSYVSGLIAEPHLGETGELFLVNRHGGLVLHRRPGELGKNGKSMFSDLEANGFRPTFTGVYENRDGNRVLGSRKWIQSLQCYLVAEQNTAEAFRQTTVLTQTALLIFAFSSLVIFCISYWVLGRATGPIKRLSETVASFADGHFEKEVSTRREDEIGRLVAGFNVMSWKLKNAYAALQGKVEASNQQLAIAYQTLTERQEQLIRSEKMAALGQLSAGFAHEIRNPLTSFKLFIQSLEKDVELDAAQKEDVEIITREIDRMNENVNRFLNFARPEEPLFERVDVGTLLKETVGLVGAKLRNERVRSEILVANNLPAVEGDPKQLTQVILNLLLNALEAMPDGGALKLSASVVQKLNSSQEFVELLVNDTGIGIPEPDRPYLFDPFFTTKASGTGLGLAIVYSIVQKHNGHIEVESEPGKGSSFRLLLPIPRETEWNAFSS